MNRDTPVEDTWTPCMFLEKRKLESFCFCALEEVNNATSILSALSVRQVVNMTFCRLEVETVGTDWLAFLVFNYYLAWAEQWLVEGAVCNIMASRDANIKVTMPNKLSFASVHGGKSHSNKNCLLMEETNHTIKH